MSVPRKTRHLHARPVGVTRWSPAVLPIADYKDEHYQKPMKKNYLHVAVGVVRRADGKMLLARRHADAHQGGLWEFPGGKVETSETVQQALNRELMEELAIRPQYCQALIQIRHHYPDRSVLLDVWDVLEYSGEPHGNEGQPIVWVEPQELGADSGYPLPAANVAIVKALNLPHHVLITGDFEDADDFLRKLQHALEQGVRLVQLRSLDSFSRVSRAEAEELAQRALALCQRFEARLVINSSLGFSLEGAGLHLAARDAHQYTSRPRIHGLLGISCHNSEELAQAERLDADYVLLSPVAKTSSHPEADALGWDAFQRLVEQVNCPVFALGGMSGVDLDEARRRGAQGIAAISAFWAEDIGL